MELQLYTPYRVLTVGPPCFVPLRNRGSSLLRRRSRRNRLAVCLFGPCAVPSPRLLPLRFSSGGFEQLRPSLGLLRNLSPSLAAERLRRWPSLCCEGGVPNSSPSRLRSPLGAIEGTIIRRLERGLKCHPSGVQACEDVLYLRSQKGGQKENLSSKLGVGYVFLSF